MHKVTKLLEQKDSQCALKIQEEVEKAKTQWRQTLIGRALITDFGYAIITVSL